MPTRKDLILKLTTFLLLCLLCYQSNAQKGGYFRFGTSIEPRTFIPNQGPFEFTAYPAPSLSIGYGKVFQINNETFIDLSGSLKSFPFAQRFKYTDDEGEEFTSLDYSGLMPFPGYEVSLTLKKELWANTFFSFGIGVEKLLSAGYSSTHTISDDPDPINANFDLRSRNAPLFFLNAAASKIWWVNEQNTRPIELELSSFLRFSDHFEGQATSTNKSQKYTDDISTGRLGVMLSFHVYLNKQIEE